MILVKSCMKEHHIEHGSIKLGTLHEYRDTEIAQIADREEGLFRFNVSLRGPIRLSNLWANTLFGGVIGFGNGERLNFPGRVTSESQSVKQLFTTDEYTDFGDSQAIINRSTLNSFIFCMSAVDRPEEASGIFPDYNDSWHIPEHKIEIFARTITHILLDEIRNRHYTDRPMIPREIELSTVQVLSRWNYVSYTPRDILVDNNNGFSIDDLHRTLLDIEFTKPPIPFQKEKEFRFQFSIISENKFVPPLDNYLIISSEKLIEHVGKRGMA